MRIAVITGPSWPVPPIKYGGTERIVSLIAKGLSELGHDITLYASGDSTAVQNIRSTVFNHLGDESTPERYKSSTRELLKLLLTDEHSYDVIINSCDITASDIVSQFSTPIFTILHMPLFDETIDILSTHPENKLVSISNAQREPAQHLNYISTIRNSIDVKSVPFARQTTNDKLVYLGTLHPWKGIHLLRKVSESMNMPIILAGQISDKIYYEREIKPFEGTNFTYIGEVNDKEKYKLLSASRALLHPVLVRDSCPLTLMEAAACGTPVIAFDNGAPRELISQSKTGYVVSDIESMIHILESKQDKLIDSRECRQYAEKYFDKKRMVSEYEALCLQLAS